MTLRIFARPFPEYDPFRAFYTMKGLLDRSRNRFYNHFINWMKEQRVNMKQRKNFFDAARVGVALLVVALLALWWIYRYYETRSESSTTFVMDTVMQQNVYGPRAKEAIQQVTDRIASMESELSLYEETSDIARLNTAAGESFVELSSETYQLLEQAKTLSAQAPDAFAITIAPLTLAWGITTDSPRVPTQEEIDELLPLVDDQALILRDGQGMLEKKGQAVDLGGIAKGAACDAAAAIYDEMKVENALLNLGGSTIYARGTKPDGTAFRIGFRDPAGDQSSALLSFSLQNAVFSTSGGYERFFEQDGVRYQHILDPQTGWPVQSDLLSVGVLMENGAEADFYSTALFAMGRDKALEYMQKGISAILLDEEGTLYVSSVFRDSLELLTDDYQVVYVE